MTKYRTFIYALVACLCSALFFGCSSTPEPAPVKKQDANNAPKKVDKTDVLLAKESGNEASEENLKQFEDFLEREKLVEQESHFLARHYLNTAKKNAAEGKYEDAYNFAQEVINIDPQNKEAYHLRKNYGERLGIRPEEISGQYKEALDLEKVKIQQLELEINNRIAQGKRYSQAEEYGKAVPKFKQAKELMKLMPYSSKGYEKNAQEIDSLIQNSEESYRSQEAERLAIRKQNAEDEAKRQEAQRLQTQNEKISHLFRKANLSFERERYELAQRFCDQILLMDPDNAKADSLRRLIKEANYSKIDQNNKSRYLEEWKKTFARVDEDALPEGGIVKFPNLKRWQEIEKRAEGQEREALVEDSPETRSTKNRLETEVLSMDFSEAPLTEVVDFLVTTTGINIIMDPAIYKEYPEEEALQVDLTVNKLKLKSILELILTLKGLDYRIENGVVIISTTKRTGEKPVLHIYDVNDITGDLPDFAAPEINLVAVSGNDELSGVELIEADEPTGVGITEEQLTDLIKQNIAKNSWDLAERSIDTRSGTLIVRQTKSVHSQLQTLLSDLRKSTGLLVTIEVRYVQVQNDFLEDVGVDWRSLGAVDLDGVNENAEPTGLVAQDRGTDLAFRGLDDVIFNNQINRGAGGFFNSENVETRQRVENIFNNTFGGNDLQPTGGLTAQIAYIDDVELQAILRAVRKSNRSNQVDSIRLTVFNTQRANVALVTQTAYIQDFDVEIATNATIADPIIGTIQEGLVLDVRPIISADRKYITMELQPTLAEIDDLRNFTTQLASGQGNNAATAVTIQLPDIRMSKIKTTVTIPDGGTLIIGGLAELARDDFKSDIPFISDIPLLSFVTSRKGTFSDRKSLLLLVRAQITSMEELEPKSGFNR